MSTHQRLRVALASALLLTQVGGQKPADALPTDTTRPNILWIYVEDTNDWMSCYGDELIQTPNIDALAVRGTRFTRAYMPAGVCSPTRSAIITGMHQTTIGAHQHYSSFERWRRIKMDEWDPNYLGVRTIPEILRLARYYTFNKGKLHYNFVYDTKQLYDSQVGKMNFQGAQGDSCWNGNKTSQPFFGQIQMTGGKTRAEKIVDRAKVNVPPYYPDHPAFREAIGKHYDTILDLDAAVGDIVAALKRDGLFENTVIFFFSDHGMSLMRHKQFLYEGGIRVPCIIAGPGIPKGKVRDDIVSGIDLSATTLALAGINIPSHMQGKDIFAKDYERDHFVAARDRCDYTIDRIRAVVTERYKYIRNFMTDRPYLQPQYRDGRPEMQAYRKLYADGKLNAVQAAFAAPHRPAEELFDLAADPHETVNLVHHPEHAQALGEMRTHLSRWIVDTDDQGRFPESDAALKGVLKRWGKKAVNREGPAGPSIVRVFERTRATRNFRGLVVSRAGRTLPMKTLRRILVPTDFSEPSVHALKRAVELARESDAEILLLYVMRDADFPTRLVLQHRKLPDLQDEIRRGVEAHLQQFKAEQIPAGVRSRALMSEGVPSEAIASVAEKNDVDLIVVATHGRTGLTRFFVGSTTERVIRLASCSVLVVKENRTDGDADAPG